MRGLRLPLTNCSLRRVNRGQYTSAASEQYDNRLAFHGYRSPADDQAQKCTLERVQAAVKELQALRSADEHLPSAVSSKLQKLIQAPDAEPNDHRPTGRHPANLYPDRVVLSVPNKSSEVPPGLEVLTRRCSAALCPPPLSHKGPQDLHSPAVSTALQRGGSSGALGTSPSSAFQARQGETLVVDRVTQWRRRKDVAACRCDGCQVVHMQQNIVFMLLHHERAANGLERFLSLSRRQEFALGTQYHDFCRGFAVAETPEEAWEHPPCPVGLQSSVSVVKGIANGVGYRRHRLVYTPSFRPVCAMDFVEGGPLSRF